MSERSAVLFIAALGVVAMIAGVQATITHVNEYNIIVSNITIEEFIGNSTNNYTLQDFLIDTDTIVSNCSVDQSCAAIIYDTDEANLNVNSSDYWDNYDTPAGWDLDSSNDLTALTLWTGDLGGTGSSPTVDDDSHNHSCANITGATSDLCTLVDTDTTFNITYDAKIGWGDVPTCSGSDKLTSTDGISFTCGTDLQGGGSGGVNYWQVYGNWMSPNLTAGAKNDINISNMNASGDIVLGGNMDLGCGNLTGGSDGDYCADSAYNQTYESTFNNTYDYYQNGSHTNFMQNWSFINYPGACSAGQYISALGNVPVCGTPTDTDTDTNASTECAGTTTYLDGEGNCDDISGVYVQAADWTTIDNYPAGGSGLLCVQTIGDTLTFVNADTGNSSADIQGVSVGGEVSGTVGSITINNDALDDQYYDSEADLTGLLDDNYVDITGDKMTGELYIESANITINATYGICLYKTGGVCQQYIMSNTTHVIIQG